MSKTELSTLFSKYLQDSLTPAELDRLFELMGSRYDHEELDDVLKELLMQEPLEDSDQPAVKAAAFDRILQRLEDERPAARLPPRRRWLAAAAILAGILIISGGLLLTRNSKKPGNAIAHNIIPGGNKAVLTLASGQQITLDNAGNGQVAQQGSAQVVKVDSGLLAYHADASAGGQVSYNTLSTPRGGQFQLILPDGSHVWLNAASTLHYPTSFTGKAREVELSGEGYFEINPNAKQPFKVKAGNVEVDVLGTAFNIMAYADERVISTTLASGTVKVGSGDAQLLLRPGQQAALPAGATQFSLSTPDMKEVLAWKEGKFRFDGADIRSIMRQVARWYNVDVVYAGDIRANELTGVISREQSISVILNALEQTGNIHFKTEGRTITVLPGAP